jgi:hypothetical protein
MTPELSFSPVQKETLNHENSSARDGINVNGSLKSNISRLYSSSTQKRMSNSRNKTEDSASSFIRNILGNNSISKQFKSELKALLDDFSAKRREFIPHALIEKEEKRREKSQPKACCFSAEINSEHRINKRS